MSSGRTHAIANGFFLAATVVLVAPNVPTDMAIGAIMGAAQGFFCTPDIDHHQITHEERRVFRWFGHAVGVAYVWFWGAYERRHNHRGVSHKPIIGTFTRWRYAGLRLFPLLILWLWINPGSVLIAFVFNCIQDVIHLLLDGWNYHEKKRPS